MHPKNGLGLFISFVRTEYLELGENNFTAKKCKSTASLRGYYWMFFILEFAL